MPKMDVDKKIKVEVDEDVKNDEEMDVDTKVNVKVEEDEDVKENREIDSLDALGPYIAEKDNAKSFVHFSKIPQICFDEPCMLGVDEAGRGPVLGPMVYGIAFCPLEKADILKTLGCADSKQLTEEKRDIIFNDICTKEYANTNMAWAVEVISPNVISNSMFRRSKHSLNEVSMDSAIGLIHQAVALGANIAEVYVDTVGPPEKYEAKLSKIFPDFKITVAKKADSTYPIVSAASICAKVSRDHALKVWKFPEGISVEAFGSGYPGDPVTKRFLQENIDPIFGFPRLVRFSWSTAENILLAKAIGMQFEDNEETPKNKKTKAITNFFNSDKPATRPRHTFFRDRCLDNVVDI